jgi:hypothetical protein
VDVSRAMATVSPGMSFARYRAMESRSFNSGSMYFVYWPPQCDPDR